MHSTRRARLFAAAAAAAAALGIFDLGASPSGVAGLGLGRALADGPEDYGYYNQDPGADPSADPNANPALGQVYQPPPEGVCFDDNNQAYDCSKDEDFASYSQVDDGYDPVAYQDFRDALMPYGSWLETAQYGQVWIPSPASTGQDFQPYLSNGRWVFTDYGWTWVSEYSWGWAPFHYGRWVTLQNHGWAWVPGRVWGPAWVHWRAGGGYVGWAPLPPRGVRIAPPVVGARFSPWCFVPTTYITAPRLSRVDFGLLPGIYVRTTIANDFRAIGTSRVIVGPPSHFLPAVRVTPSPLRMWAPAMPRAQIVVRPGVPLMSRPYYAPYQRANYAPGGRPYGGYGSYGAPVVRPAPVYRPGPMPPPVYQHPGPRPAPGYQHPGPMPPPVYQNPGPRPGPVYQNPGPMPPPVYQHPGPRPAPGYQNPGPMPPPVYQNPGPGPAPPVFQHPSPPPVYQNPGPRPAPPVFQHPSPSPPPVYHPAPRPSPPVFQHPSPPPVMQHPSPPPVHHQAPSHSPPVFQRPAGGTIRVGPPR
ncbi:MAG: DUF6600 domain-containing protein [Polyangia bacterium]